MILPVEIIERIALFCDISTCISIGKMCKSMSNIRDMLSFYTRRNYISRKLKRAIITFNDDEIEYIIKSDGWSISDSDFVKIIMAGKLHIAKKYRNNHSVYRIAIKICDICNEKDVTNMLELLNTVYDLNCMPAMIVGTIMNANCNFIKNHIQDIDVEEISSMFPNMKIDIMRIIFDGIHDCAEKLNRMNYFKEIRYGTLLSMDIDKIDFMVMNGVKLDINYYMKTIVLFDYHDVPKKIEWCMKNFRKEFNEYSSFSYRIENLDVILIFAKYHPNYNVAVAFFDYLRWRCHKQAKVLFDEYPLEILNYGIREHINILFKRLIHHNAFESADVLFNAFPVMLNIPRAHNETESNYIEEKKLQQKHSEEYFDEINNELYTLE